MLGTELLKKELKKTVKGKEKKNILVMFIKVPKNLRGEFSKYFPFIKGFAFLTKELMLSSRGKTE